MPVACGADAFLLGFGVLDDFAELGDLGRRDPGYAGGVFDGLAPVGEFVVDDALCGYLMVRLT